MIAPALNREQSREIDRLAIEELGIPSIVLMENAGRGAVDVLERLGINGPVDILCGKGNNAGDGFVMARHLDLRGHRCRVLLFSPAGELRGDAAINFAVLTRSGVSVVDFGAETLAALVVDTEADWIVDALLGTGAQGEPRPPLSLAIDWMNGQRTKRLAVDVPSGLDCNTGKPSIHTVRADHTCTFAAVKVGFLELAAKPYTGTVHVCDIGLPPRLFPS